MDALGTTILRPTRKIGHEIDVSSKIIINTILMKIQFEKID